MISFCVFCDSKLKSGWENHFKINHGYSLVELEKLYCFTNFFNVKNSPIYIPKPTPDYNSKEFDDYLRKFENETSFLFENEDLFKSKRKHKKNRSLILNDYKSLVKSKLKILTSNLYRYGGGEFITKSFELKAYELLVTKFDTFNDSDDKIYDNENDFWDRIFFDDGSVLFTYKSNRKIRITTPSSAVSLNVIKDEYFRVKFSSYNIVVTFDKNKVKLHYSNNQKIEDLIRLNSTDIHFEIEKHNNSKLESKNTVACKVKSLERLIEKNNYIKIAASICAGNDQIFPVIENNNGKKENLLFIVYRRLEGVYVNIENENHKRSAYLIYFEDYSEEFLSILKAFFESDKKNKRQILKTNPGYVSNFFKSHVKIMCIYHNSSEQYSKSLLLKTKQS